MNINQVITIEIDKRIRIYELADFKSTNYLVCSYLVIIHTNT